MPTYTPPTDAAFRVSAARLRMMQSTSAGLLGEVGYSLEHRPDATIPTLCTDGKAVRYNSAFIASLSDTDAETALLHEYAHVTLLHPVRILAGSYEPQLANVAMDYAANEWLAKCGRTIPADWIHDEKWKGMAWEAIYTALKNEQPPAPQQPQDSDEEDQRQDPGNAPQDAKADPQSAPDSAPGTDPAHGSDDAPAQPGKPGQRQEDVKPYPGKDGNPATAEEVSAAAAELTDRISRIAEAHMLAGHGSDNARRLFEAIATPKDPDLYDAIARLLERSPNDHTYRRLNRRLLHVGIFPGLEGEECGPLVIAIDTSGSISDAILAAFQDKVSRAVADFRPREVTIIYCDDEINGEPQTFTADNVPDLEPRGGGSTDFRPPFEWVSANMTAEPAALVYLTDLCGYGPMTAPTYPVIWAAIPSGYQKRPAFGQIVPLILR